MTASHRSPLFALGLLTLLACAPRRDAPQEQQQPDVAVAAPTDYSLQWRDDDQPITSVPAKLTASDGTGLRMTKLEAKALVQDPLAFTELRMTFHNPENRVREGRFEITLPPGAAISRFAMNIDGKWQEAEVVERQKARRVYEDFLHRRQDPALMEKKAGNQFRARVFPIPANGTKELIVSFSQDLTNSAEPYRLWLKGLPELDELDVDVMVDAGGSSSMRSSAGGRSARMEHLTLHESHYAPKSDLEVKVDGRPSNVGLRHDNLTVARFKPALDLPREPITGLTVLFDTSASRALGFEAQARRLDELLQAVKMESGQDFDVRVLAFDQRIDEVYRGPASGFGQEGVRALVRRRALGASDVAGALDQLNAMDLPHDRILLVSDGIATSGERDHAKLRDAVSRLQAGGVTRLDAVVDGGIQDPVLLAHLTRSDLPHKGVVADARMKVSSVAHKLTRATRSDLKIHVEGASWVWPQTLDSLQPGDEVTVFADLPEGTPMKIEVQGLDMGPVEVPLQHVPRPLLEREWVQAEIERLEAVQGETKDTAERKRAKDRILELSTKHRVLSDATAMLVLESENDYRRYDIDRTALANILTVGSTGLEFADRRTEEAQIAAVEKPPMEQAFDGALKGGKKKKRKKKIALNTERKEARADKLVLGGSDDWESEEEDEELMKNEAPGGAPADLPRPTAPSTGRAAENRPSPTPDADVDGLAVADPEPELEPEAPRARPPARRGAPAFARDEAAEIHGVGGNFDAADPRPQDAWDGPYKDIMAQIAAGKTARALESAWAWRLKEPGSELALLALGDAAEAAGKFELAARAYGSIIDLFPSRADLRRMAGERLERVHQRSGGEFGLGLAIDTYREAVAQRPDHPASHRLLAYALSKAGRHAEAFDAIMAGVERSYPGGRFAGVPRILKEDAAILAAVYQANDGKAATTIRTRMASRGISAATTASTRFVLNWETDANDVDFHIFDGKRGHAFYSHKVLASGGSLYADVTTGYGPECFTIEGKPGQFPYTMQAHYYARGPQGYGMGKLQIVEHDGKGNLWFDENPFVIMKDGAYVDLGHIEGPLSAGGKASGQTGGLPIAKDEAPTPPSRL